MAVLCSQLAQTKTKLTLSPSFQSVTLRQKTVSVIWQWSIM
uniref:Uncharacterized protein n=1 Tax=Anguilla anguilla TaxID=7936 RepID=A0A0E9U427_ANGAN